MSARAGGLVLLGAAGLLLQVGLVVLGTLTYQLSQQLAFTDLYLERYPAIQQLLAPLLQIGASVVPEVASPRAPAELGAWFAPLTAAWAVGCLITALGYLGALWVLSRRINWGGPELAVILAFELLFVVTVFVAPGLLSQDIFGYLMYGQVADVHGLNPYIWPPSAFAHDAMLKWVAPIWRTLPSPYGPVWTDVNWALSRVVRDWSVVEQVLAYKLLASILLLVCLGQVWWLLGRLHSGERARSGKLLAFTALAWNPLVLIETVGNGHNDVLALALLLAGLVAVALHSADKPRGPVRLLASAGFCVLSGLVKFLSGIGVVFLLVGVLRGYPERRRRVVLLGAAVVWMALLTVILFGPWLELPDSVDSIVRQTGGNLYANAVPDLVSLTVSDQVLTRTGIPLALARDASRLAMKAVVDLFFALYLLWEVRQLWRGAAVGGNTVLRGIARASARSSLVLILLVSIWVQPWYFILPLGLSIVLGMHEAVTRVAVGYTLTALVALYVHYYLQDTASGVLYLAYAAVPLVTAIAISRRSAYALALGSGYRGARHAVRLIDESGQALIPNAARSAAVAEIDPGSTHDGPLR